ncbi:TPA: exo-alpha-sialidase [Candidatus Poribacteria bacterium]|nr:exo-alpha-sialidase [Candidatus Poribacteria bacterium]
MKKNCSLWRYDLLKIFSVGLLFIGGSLQPVYTDQRDFILVRNPKKLYEGQLKANRISVGISGDDTPSVIFSRSYFRGDQLFLFATRDYQFKNGKLREEIVLYTSLDQGETWSDWQVLPVLGGEPRPSITKRGTILITTRLLAEDIRNTLGYTHSYLYRSTDNLKTIEQVQITAEFFPQIMVEVPQTAESRLETDQDGISLKKKLLSDELAIENVQDRRRRRMKTSQDLLENTEDAGTIKGREELGLVDTEKLSTTNELAIESVQDRRRRRMKTSQDLLENIRGTGTIAEREELGLVDTEKLSTTNELAIESVQDRRRRRIETSQDLLELIGERESTVDILPTRPTQEWVLTSRNVLELTDGSLILGVSMPNGIDYLWRSTNQGRTWDTTTTCHFEGVDPNRINHPFFGEGVFWQPTNRDLLVLVSVNSGLFPIGNHQILATDLNQTKRLVIFRSEDLGRNWRRDTELGSDYGEMYPGLIRLRGGKLLMTFTVRNSERPLGLRAVFGKERPFGFDFDFQYDRLILNRAPPINQEIGGGFGNTLQIENKELITSYSYQGTDGKTHLAIVKWAMPSVWKRSIDF